MDPLTDKLISYAQDLSYEDLPREVIDRAKHFILDAVGCALGAAPSPPGRIVRAVASRFTSATPATVMISGDKTSPDMAAFANGTMTRYLDWNDGYTSNGTCHPSDMLAPALAATEAAGLDGKALILGLVLGYEVQCGLTDSNGLEREGGASQTINGAVASAVLAAKLMGLDKEKMSHAVNMAISACRTLGRQSPSQLSHWKEAHVANASRNALFCTLMAAEGLTGPDIIFEDPAELLPFGGKGRNFRIMESRVKHFPSGYFSQSAIEAAQEVRPKISRVSDIEEVRLQTFPSGFNAMGSNPSRWRPDNRETADHSLPFVLAMALMEGTLEIRHFDEEYFLKPDVTTLMDKIKISVGDECVQAWPEVPLNIVDVQMRSGEVHSARVGYHLGHFNNLMSDADQERKFRPMAEDYGKLPKEQVNRLLDQLRKFEQVQDIGQVLALTVPPEPQHR
ncbi:MAG: MmgE/PrpD family protein [Dehalococcoidia bacterium]